MPPQKKSTMPPAMQKKAEQMKASKGKKETPKQAVKKGGK